jgi:hypothetical protein
VDTLDEIQLLKKIQLFQDIVVEGLKAFGFPELRKASLLPKVMLTDDRAQKLIHQDVFQDNCAPRELILCQLKECCTSLWIRISCNLIAIEPEGRSEMIELRDQFPLFLCEPRFRHTLLISSRSDWRITV